MTVTPQSFRVDFPEFGDVGRYPDSSINFQLATAGMLLNQNLWGAPAASASSPPTAIYDVGLELYTAHYLVLEAKQMREANTGALPGQTRGPITNESVGSVSVGYDTQAVIEPDAGHWNLSVFGIRFIRLSKQFGAVPFSIAGNVCTDPLNSTNAWAGPWPGVFNFSL
jgi:hypothetical protein